MHPAALTDLADVLGRQVAAADRLLEALEEERAVLAGRGAGPAALEAATAEKQRRLVELERIESARRTVLGAAGYGPGPADMVQFLRATEGRAHAEGSPHPGPVGSHWRRVLASIARLRDANERNGMIVGIRNRQVRQLLNVLRTGRPDELTYGPDGGAHAGHSRALGRA